MSCPNELSQWLERLRIAPPALSIEFGVRQQPSLSGARTNSRASSVTYSEQWTTCDLVAIVADYPHSPTTSKKRRAVDSYHHLSSFGPIRLPSVYDVPNNSLVQHMTLTEMQNS